jgi:3-oxoacyl-[acyl-carrier protein] reductase
MGDTLKGRVAIVTGSGHGIGRAIAVAFAGEGAKVVTNNRKPGGRVTSQAPKEIIDTLDEAALKKLEEGIRKHSGDAETTARTIRDKGGEATAVFGDISKWDDAKRLVDTTVETYGKIDIIVNVAGILAQGSVEDITEAAFDECVTAKPKGYFHIVRFAVPHMAKAGYGRILNCASGAYMGDMFFDDSHYCASNAGVVGFSAAIARELFDKGITVNTFCPGAATRPHIEADDQPHFEDRPLLPPQEEPEALAPFIIYLCSEKTSEITGATFGVYGATIQRHSESPICKTMIKPDDKGPWTVEEIDGVVDRFLLNDYHSIVPQLRK